MSTAGGTAPQSHDAHDVPDSFDPEQPDLPTLAVDPDPSTSHDGQDTGYEPLPEADTEEER
ncbi:chromosome partitioning protein [Actinotalea solisilvae]|uniref:chromosome partitioning protein n=1 Tax=Actinotalea solisilvae TaxID=2072922 RepID=UPI0018F2055A|nr:chromosome partitioning protein [Actinotalea solisilvae]